MGGEVPRGAYAAATALARLISTPYLLPVADAPEGFLASVKNY
jgi:hypothetical protein